MIMIELCKGFLKQTASICFPFLSDAMEYKIPDSKDRISGAVIPQIREKKLKNLYIFFPSASITRSP